MRYQRFVLQAFIIAVAVSVAACGSSTSGSDGDAAPDPSTSETPDTVPQQGGSITIARFTETKGLDPTVVTSGAGTVGGVELAAIYDTVVRWNPDSHEYEPRTGTFEPNDDLTTWTLELRPGIQFADGTPYDAAAVKFNVERHMAPQSRSNSKLILTTMLDSMEIGGPTTVVFHLKEAWAGFPSLFAKEAGMVVSPTAVAAAGENFNVQPGEAGAGPFRVKSYRPGETLVLERNPSYWDTPALLDEVRFVLVAGGSQPETHLAFQAGDVHAFIARAPQVAAAVADDDATLIDSAIPGGSVLMMNSGIRITCKGEQPAPACAGKPDGEAVQPPTATADPRVRRAIALAVDPDVVNARAFDGDGKVGTALFQEGLPFVGDIDPLEPDIDEAKALVAAAKADGWDGNVRLHATNNPVTSAIALTTKTLLETAGMTVSLDGNGDAAAMVQQVLVKRDFDVAVNWSFALTTNPDEVYVALMTNFSGPSPRYGYSSPELDDALDRLRVARDEAEVTDAIDEINRIWSRDVPAAIVAEGSSRWVLTAQLHGVTPSLAEVILLDDAWLAQ